MLLHANTPFTYISEYVSALYGHEDVFVKSSLRLLRGYKFEGLILHIRAGTWRRIQEKGTKGHQRDPFVCHEGDGTGTAFQPNKSLLTCLPIPREPKTSASTLNSTRKSGRRALKVCHTDCA